MVAIFTGLGAGLARGSAGQLGGAGLLGSGSLGRSRDKVFLNAATGNLLINQQDESLVGLGPDAAISRTYNSFGDMTDDNGDNWRQSTDRRIYGLTGTLNTAGATAKLSSADGSEITYTYQTLTRTVNGTTYTESAYFATDGAGAYDKLEFNATTFVWKWTDGDTGASESYQPYGVNRLNGTANTSGSWIRRFDASGALTIYNYDTGSGKYIVSAGTASTDYITYAGGAWSWTYSGTTIGQVYNNTSAWRVVSQTDTSGNTLTYSYGSNDQLYRVTTADGGYTQYSWSGTNITQITTGYTDLVTSAAKTLTRTRYGYDGSNRLTTVTVDLTPGDNSVSDGATYVTTYTYDGTSKRVASITQTDGSSVAIAYDGSNRVHTLTQTVSTGVTRVTTIDYFTGYTNITDASGQVTRLDYDASDQLTKITAPAAYTGASQQITQFAYNATGDLISTTDALGKVTSYTYDSYGNALTVTDPLSNVVTRTFDTKNQVLTETRPGSLTTRYAYDANQRLEYLVSAEGRVTHFSYDSHGNAIADQVYVGGHYDVSALASGTPLTSAQIATWASGLSDKTQFENTARTFDARGDLLTETEYASDLSTGAPNTSGSKKTTSYVYDNAGQLLSRTVSGLNTETFVYDGLGRVTASTDLNGGTTTFAFGDAAGTTTVTLASGYVTVRTYNKAGDLVSVTDSGTNTSGGTTGYAYDKLGRVRVTTDALGRKLYAIYDKAGRHTGDVDNDGNLIEYRYDADNRLVGTIQYHTLISSTNLASLANPDAVSDVATIRPATSTQDTASWIVYDADGRVLETIAGDGSAAISTYDGAGRLLQTTAYYNKIAAATVSGFITGSAPSTVLTPTADSARDLIARNFYDKDGLLVGKLDGEGYLTQNVYDDAGRLITTIASATQVALASRAGSSFATLQGLVGTSADDRISHLVYDDRGLIRYKIDEVVVAGVAKGRVTAYTYPDNLDQPARVAVYDGYMAATSNYTLANIQSLTATLDASTGNRVTYNNYDSAGRLAYTTSAIGLVSSFKYDTMGQVIRTVAFATARAVTSQPLTSDLDTWQAAHLADTGNRIVRAWYTARGETAYTADAEGYVTKSDFDAKGQLTGTTRWATAITTSDTTTYSQVTAALSGATETMGWQYDSLGRTTRATDALGNYTTYTYHGATKLVNTVTRAANGTAQEQSVTTTTYDAAGRAIQTVSAVGTSEQTTSSLSYDGRGLAATGTDGRGNVTSFTYDLDGRVKAATNALSGVTTYDYNAFGQVWRAQDPNGNYSYTWYDKLGRVVASRDGLGYLTTTSYTAFGDIASTTRYMTALTGTPAIGTVPTGSGTAATTAFTYDKAGRVLTATDALNNVQSYAYNLFDRTSFTNKLGAVTNYVYDRLGRLTRQGYAAVTTNYQTTGNYSGGTLVTGTAITGAENVTTYTYDAFGNVKQQVEGYATSLGGTVTALRTTGYNYDAANQRTSVTHDAVTVIADDMVTLSSTTPTEQFTYDKRGNVVLAVDAGGAATYSYYDDLDRKTVEIRQLATSQWVYTAYGYDANGNLISTKVYDANGSAGTPPTGGTAPSAPSGTYRETDATYDALNRMQTSVVVSVAGNTFSTGSWNGSSYVTSTASLTTTYQYDADGNVVKQTAANGGVTWSWYDALGHKSAQLDPENYLSTWTYNAEENVASETRFATKFTGTPVLGTAPSVSASGDDRTTVFTYDLNGNRISEKRTGVIAWTVNATTGALTAAGTDSIVSYTYNALGQVLTKTEPTETAAIATYSYDTNGRLTTEQRGSYTDANGTTVTPTVSYAYDAIGDLITTTQAGTASGAYQALQRVTTNRYGEGGRLLSTTDAEGYVHQYYYDVMGRLKKDAYNRVVNADTYATTTGTTTVAEAQTSTYDISGRVLSQSIYSTVGGSFQRVGYYSYQYNNFGQVTAQGIGSNSASGMNAGSAQYQVTNLYDAAGHLSGSNSGDGVWKFYSYDGAGNQTASITSAGASFTSTTGFAGALALVGNANVDGTFSVYDKRGLATQVIEEGRDLSATVTNQTLNTYRSYNAFGDVATETDARGVTVTYVYNTMGRKIRTDSPAVSITLENGQDIWVKPSDEAYFDLAGRQVGARDANGTYGTAANTQATAYAKAANTGNLTTYALLAGTGYDKSAALISTEFHADGGRKQQLFDVMGDLRIVRDELYSSTSPYMHVEELSYNRLGQLVQDKHNRVTNVTSASDDTTRLIDVYVYDQFGQRIQHKNSEYDYSGVSYSYTYYGAYYTTPYTILQVEKNDYDALGRVKSQTDLSGYVTTTAYAWDGTMATSINGSAITLGGWAEVTTYANSRTTISKQDIYNHEVFNQDMGGHQVAATFDAAGRMVTRGSNVYTWYNTGMVATSAIINGTVGTSVYDRKLSTYGYDAAGHRTSEVTSTDGSQMVYYGSIYYSYSAPSSYSYTLVNETAAYDALGRLTTVNTTATSYLPTASLTEKYDAVGNIRNTVSSHAVLDGGGSVSATVTDNYWFRYDSMNRLVTDKGMLSGTAGAAGTTVVRGTAGGQDYQYDTAGQRVAAIRTDYSPGSYTYYYGYYPGTYAETRENDEYDGAGRVADIKITQGAAAYETYDYSTGTFTPPNSIPTAPVATSSTPLSSVFGYDLMGRQTSQVDYSGTTVTYSRSASYAYNGFLLSDSTTTKRYESNYTTNLYTTYNSYSQTSSTGEYLLGAVGAVTATNYKNSSYQNASSTTTSYVWFGSALQGSIAYKPNTSQSTTYYTYFNYDAQGTLMSVSINDGRPRTATYITDGDSQVIRRDEQDYTWWNASNQTGGDPHELWYRFGGKELGYVGNNGTGKLSESASIYDRQAYKPNGAFRNGASYASSYSDFAESSGGPINSYNQGAAAGGYTVARNGETLRSVAQQLWGDSSLWYKIADANGITGDTQLTEGQHLTLPAGVARNHNNASTFSPYDPTATIGNVSPTTPQPPKKSSCGGFGAILLAVIALAVTVVATAGAAAAIGNVAFHTVLTGMLGGLAAGSAGATAFAGIGAATWIAAGAIGGAIGSIVSQGVGVATGIQDKFSWKAVGLAAIGGAVGGALGPGGVFGKTGMFGGGAGSITSIGSPVLRAGLNGMVSSALTQGLGVATGLQDKFSWAGVAAAGVGAAAATAAFPNLPSLGENGTLGNYAAHLGQSAVSLIANAATRSAIEGTDFGDNVMAGLPDVIAQTLGDLLMNKIVGDGGSDTPHPVANPTSSAGDASPPASASLNCASSDDSYLSVGENFLNELLGIPAAQAAEGPNGPTPFTWDGPTYKIMPGQTLSEIAAYHGTTVEALLELNKGNTAAVQSADMIIAGETLALPKTDPNEIVIYGVRGQPDASASPAVRAAWYMERFGATSDQHGRPLAGSTFNLRDAFNPALGSNAPGAIIIGNAEGNRTPDGGFTPFYYGHTDPGNGVWNTGSFSHQNHRGILAPEAADAFELTRLRTRLDPFETAATNAGLDPNNPLLSMSYLDTYNQSPRAAQYFLDNISQLSGQEITIDSIVALRSGYFVNHDTGLRNPGRGGGLLAIANRNRISYSTEVTRDQTRRENAVQRALTRTGY